MRVIERSGKLRVIDTLETAGSSRNAIGRKRCWRIIWIVPQRNIGLIVGCISYIRLVLLTETVVQPKGDSWHDKYLRVGNGKIAANQRILRV